MLQSAGEALGRRLHGCTAPTRPCWGGPPSLLRHHSSAVSGIHCSVCHVHASSHAVLVRHAAVLDGALITCHPGRSQAGTATQLRESDGAVTALRPLRSVATRADNSCIGTEFQQDVWSTVPLHEVVCVTPAWRGSLPAAARCWPPHAPTARPCAPAAPRMQTRGSAPLNRCGSASAPHPTRWRGP